MLPAAWVRRHGVAPRLLVAGLAGSAAALSVLVSGGYAQAPEDLRPVLLLAALVLTGVTGGALWSAASGGAQRRATGLATLRMRGASGTQAGWAVARSLLVVAAAAAAGGGGLGWAVGVGVLGIDIAPRVAPVAAVAVVVVVLSVFGAAAAGFLLAVRDVRGSGGSVREPARTRRSRGRRAAVEVVVVGLAAVAAARLPGSAQAAAFGAGGQPDALVLLTPALVLVAGAMVAARVLTAVAAGAAALARRSRGIGGLGAASSAGRQPRAVVVVVVLAVAGALTVAAWAATSSAAAREAAAVVVGADLRVLTGRSATAPGSIEAFGDGAALAALPVTTAVAPAVRQVTRAEGAVDLLALDTRSAEPALSAATRSRAALSAALPGLAEGVPRVAGWPVPAGSAELVAGVRAERPVDLPEGFRAGRQVVQVTALLAGPGGTGAALPLGEVPIGRAGEVRARLPQHAPGFRLVGLDLRVPAGPEPAAEVVVTVESLTAQSATTAPADLRRARVEWAVGPVTVPAGQDRPRPRLSTADGGRPTVRVSPVGGGSDRAQVRLLLGDAPVSAAPVPAVLTRLVAADLGVGAGDVVELGRPGGDLAVRVVAVVDALPGGGAEQRVALVEAAALTASDLAAGRTLAAPTEWWVDLSEPLPEGAVEGALRGTPRVEVLDRAALDRAAAALPGSAPGRAAAVAALGAVGVAAVGAGGAVADTLSARRRELALLRALGANRRQILAPVVAEALGLVVAAVAMGALLAASALPAVMPALLVDAGAGVALPPPRAVLPLGQAVAVSAVILTVLVAAVLAGVAAARPARAAGAVRLGEDT